MTLLNITAIIQARMGSTRLPHKVLAEIAGHPMLYHVVNRARQARQVGQVVVATSTNPADEVIAQFCQAHDIGCFRGNEHDVLDRYYQTACSVEAEVVIRLTADCPLLDPTVIDKVIETFLTGRYDYVSNTLSPTYPDGLDTEVFTFAALKQAWEQAKLKSEREHVTSFIYKRPEQFRLGNVAHEVDLSHLRWTVDEPRDLELVRQIYAHLQGQPFGMNDIIHLLKTQPDLSQLNSDIIRNEGYLKSLREDKMI